MLVPTQSPEINTCQEWYNILADYREKMNALKAELYAFAPGKTDQDVLMQIEHFHNQFHIQQINIHDLKHEIRHYIQDAERLGQAGSTDVIKEKYDMLVSDLDQLEKDFHAFIY